MKKWIVMLLLLSLLFVGCSKQEATYDIVATTLPVYDFTVSICHGTGLTVGRLVTENVSCLHDYTLQVTQMRMVEAANTVVISGAGLENFLEDVLSGSTHVIDASYGAHLHESLDGHDHEHGNDDHHHDQDPHIWLAPENAKHMAESICHGLTKLYPQYETAFQNNLNLLLDELRTLQDYGKQMLADLSCREIITFHDGFTYFAENFGLTILAAIEEESGSEPSAAEIIDLINLVNKHHLPAVFTEINGSDACAGILQAETGVQIFSLDMAMTGESYFDAMYYNIDTVKEALK